MKLRISGKPVLFIIVLFTMLFSVNFVNAAGKINLTVVGLYSETTDAAYISYRVGTGSWKVIKIGDVVPNEAEISVSVDRDWIELIPSNNPNIVYELIGSDKQVIKKVTDILNGKSRTVAFPKTGTTDPKFTNKMVVKQYLGRQTYRKDANSPMIDIKYGTVLDATGTVNIIAINNTINLVFANGKETQVVGPLKFTIDKLLKGENLYKILKG